MQPSYSSKQARLNQPFQRLFHQLFDSSPSPVPKPEKDAGHDRLVTGVPLPAPRGLCVLRTELREGVYPRTMTFQESNQARSGKTLQDGYVSFGHPSVTLQLSSGQSVAIDKGVVDLITLINSIPGIETNGSCQGEEPNYGYVQFMPDGTAGQAHASLYFMYHMLKHMHAAWVKHRHAMWEHEQSTGSEHPDAYKFNSPPSWAMDTS